MSEQPLCQHCCKPEYEHTATKKECPVGRKHRSLGYTQFGPKTFEPKAAPSTEGADKHE